MKKILIIAGIFCFIHVSLIAQTRSNKNSFYSQIGYVTNINTNNVDNFSLQYLSVNYLHQFSKHFNYGVGFASGSKVDFNFQFIFTNIITCKELELKLGYEYNFKEKIFFHTILNTGVVGIGTSVYGSNLAQDKADAYVPSIFIKPQIILNYKFSNNFSLGFSYQYQYNIISYMSSFNDFSVVFGLKF